MLCMLRVKTQFSNAPCVIETKSFIGALHIIHRHQIKINSAGKKSRCKVCRRTASMRQKVFSESRPAFCEKKVFCMLEWCFSGLHVQNRMFSALKQLQRNVKRRFAGIFFILAGLNFYPCGYVIHCSACIFYQLLVQPTDKTMTYKQRNQQFTTQRFRVNNILASKSKQRTLNTTHVSIISPCLSDYKDFKL